jgi:hypothetical protein
MSEGAPNTLGRRLVKGAEDVVDVADIKARMLVGDQTSASPTGFAI